MTRTQTLKILALASLASTLACRDGDEPAAEADGELLQTRDPVDVLPLDAPPAVLGEGSWTLSDDGTCGEMASLAYLEIEADGGFIERVVASDEALSCADWEESLRGQAEALQAMVAAASDGPEAYCEARQEQLPVQMMAKALAQPAGSCALDLMGGVKLEVANPAAMGLAAYHLGDCSTVSSLGEMLKRSEAASAAGERWFPTEVLSETLALRSSIRGEDGRFRVSVEAEMAGEDGQPFPIGVEGIAHSCFIDLTTDP